VTQELPPEARPVVTKATGQQVQPDRMHETLVRDELGPTGVVELHEVTIVGPVVDASGRPVGPQAAAGYSEQADGSMRYGYRADGELLPPVLQRRLVGMDRLRRVLRGVDEPDLAVVDEGGAS